VGRDTGGDGELEVVAGVVAFGDFAKRAHRSMLKTLVDR
jgi:hypothetical protein